MRDGWYVYTVVKQKFTYFHTLILDNLECRKRIDHINRDKLDNRRENLRFCCDQQNAFNQGMPKTNTLGYKGRRNHQAKQECVSGVPHATPDQRSYVVYRCLKRLEGIQWAQNPELLDAALRRLHREQERLAA